MIRTIKFRAKSKQSNNWVEGNLVKKQKDWYISTNGIDMDMIYPNTIGEFTGLTDSKNNYVYESDVILLDNKRYVVVWSNSCYGFYLYSLSDESKNMMALTELNGKEFSLEGCHSSTASEVITHTQKPRLT